MDIHNNLGRGFSEVVYKDALEYELRNHAIPFEREKEYAVNYRGLFFHISFMQILSFGIK